MSGMNLSVPTHTPPWLDRAARRAAFPEDGIAISADFAQGNGQRFRRLGPYRYAFRSRVAEQPYSYRFCFRVEGARPGQVVRFRVVDFKMADEPMKARELAACVSHDGREWTALDPEDIALCPGEFEADGDYGASGRAYSVEYRVTFDRSPGWFASPRPYSEGDLRALIEWASAREGVTVESLGKTAFGLDAPTIRARRPGADPERARRLFVIAGQHPSEVAGILGAEGMLREYVEGAGPLLDRVTLQVTPVTGMDGWRFGRTVVNAASAEGVNLNRDWAAVSQPETRLLVAAIERAKPDAFVDCHNGRGDAECRLQGYRTTAASVAFWDAVAARMNADGVAVRTLDRSGPTQSSVEVVNRGLCPVAAIFENVLTAPPEADAYVANGRALLRALAEELG